MFKIDLVQQDLMNPESFQYLVLFDDVFVAGFAHLGEANAFIVAHGGTAQTVIPWVKGIQAKAEK